MRKKISLAFVIVTISIIVYSQDGIIGKINSQDSIKNKIDSITTFILNPNSKFASAREYDVTTPNGIYAIYVADTTNGELRNVIYYTYNGKLMSILHYYYYDSKLIKATESRVLRKIKDDKDIENYYRVFYYWNDSLYNFYNSSKEVYDYKIDLQTAQRLLKRFQDKYTKNLLSFK